MGQNELDNIIKMRFTIVFLIIAILAIQSTLQAPERSKRASVNSETIKQVADQLKTIGDGLAKQALAPLQLGTSLAGMIGGCLQEAQIDGKLLTEAVEVENEAQKLMKFAETLDERKANFLNKMKKTNKNNRETRLEGINHRTNERRKLGPQYQNFMRQLDGYNINN
uniref:Uncharacterized protein n=1 Tax=Strongyloides stercoralis TaxID=6248 RepID=A0A0K0EIM7_STRER